MAARPQSQSPGASESYSLSGPSSKPIRRRNRIITSCLECRRRKLKCDRMHPCNACTKNGRDCVFLAPATDPTSKGKLTYFKERMNTLEKELEKNLDDHTGWTVTQPKQNLPQERRSTAPASAVVIPEYEKDIEPTPLATSDAAYEEDGGDDTMEDLGVQFGRIRITERIGGLVRPRFADEMANVQRDIDGSVSQSFDRVTRDTTPSSSISGDLPFYLKPSAEYIAPNTNLLFASSITDDSMLIQYLPSRDFSDRLLQQYWIAVHPVARTFHRPSFERQYEQFWTMVSSGFEPASRIQAQVFAALFSGAASLHMEDAQNAYGFSKEQIIESCKAGCEQALARSNLIRTTSILTLQAFVCYLIPLCRQEVSRSQAVLVAMAIRLAECMGLHRDGSAYNISHLEMHVRRIIWYQLCILDIRCTEAVCPRPQIARGTFDVKLPLNQNDFDFDQFLAPYKDSSNFTEMTLYRIRIEAYTLLREIWFDRPRIDKKELSITAGLKKIDDYRQKMDRLYKSALDMGIPEHALAARLIKMFVAKAYINLLHPYATHREALVPQLRDAIWSSGVTLLEIAIEVESSPMFRPWSWIAGATTQHHIALIFTREMLIRPDYPLMSRLLRCLDYVFQLPPETGRIEKAKIIIETSVARLDEYQRRRKPRLTSAMEQQLGSFRRSRHSSVEETRPPGSISQSPPHSNHGDRTGLPRIGTVTSSDDPMDLTSEPLAMDRTANMGATVGSFGSTGAKMLYIKPSPSITSSTSVSSPNRPPNGNDLFNEIDWNEHGNLLPQERLVGPPFPDINFSGLGASTLYVRPRRANDPSF